MISIGQLCDGGCKVLLDEEHLLAFKDRLLVLEGTRNQEDGLWDIPLPQTTLQQYKHTPLPKHAGLYAAYLRPVQNNKTPMQPSHKTKCKPRALLSHKNQDILPSIGHCNNIIQQQLKLDKKIEKANIVIRDNQPKKDLITFLHAACGAQVPST